MYFNLDNTDKLIALLFPISAFVLFMIIAFRLRKRIRTVDNYFLADRDISPIDLKATYLGTNILFASILIALAENSYKFGIITFWILIWWLAGMIFFYFMYPKISKFFKNGQTLHEFLGEKYNSILLRKLASITTIIVFSSTVGLELFGGVYILQKLGIAEIFWPFTIAFIIALILVIYTSMGGFLTVVKTDIIQIGIIAISTIIIIGYSYQFAESNKFFASLHENKDITLKSFFSDPIFIVSMFVLFFPFQFCVMDMWQRCAAVKGDVKKVKSMLRTDFLGFVFLYSIPIIIGLLVKTSNISLTDPKDAFLYPIIIEAASPYFIGFIYAGLFAAILSTADTLLVCSSHSLVHDVIHINRSNNDIADPNTKEHDLLISVKTWTGIIGLSSLCIMILMLFLSLYDLIIVVFSTQIVFFIPIIVAILFPQFAINRKTSAIVSIIVGFITPIVFVIVGKILNDKLIIDIAPIIGFVFALMSFIIFSFRTKEDIKV